MKNIPVQWGGLVKLKIILMEDKINKIAKVKYRKVREIFKNAPKQDRYSQLLEMGFEYVEEEEYNSEKHEEYNAKPLNTRQKIIVKYFEKQSSLSSNIINNFILEIENEETNYPLLRKYFKQGGDHILKLLQEALMIYPCKESLLNAFAYFNEYNNVFSELIKIYNVACKEEEDINLFQKLVRSFYINASEQNYDIFISLKELCKNDKQKLNVLNKIGREFKAEIDVDSKFH